MRARNQSRERACGPTHPRAPRKEILTRATHQRVKLIVRERVNRAAYVSDAQIVPRRVNQEAAPREPRRVVDGEREPRAAHRAARQHQLRECLQAPQRAPYTPRTQPDARVAGGRLAAAHTQRRRVERVAPSRQPILLVQRKHGRAARDPALHDNINRADSPHAVVAGAAAVVRCGASPACPGGRRRRREHPAETPESALQQRRVVDARPPAYAANVKRGCNSRCRRINEPEDHGRRELQGAECGPGRNGQRQRPQPPERGRLRGRNGVPARGARDRQDNRRVRCGGRGRRRRRRRVCRRLRRRRVLGRPPYQHARYRRHEQHDNYNEHEQPALVPANTDAPPADAAAAAAARARPAPRTGRRSTIAFHYGRCLPRRRGATPGVASRGSRGEHGRILRLDIVLQAADRVDSDADARDVSKLDPAARTTAHVAGS
jgi:hypothetical protein